MKQLVENFGAQLLEALDNNKKVKFVIPKSTKINNIVISGLGGSGIGGTIITDYLNHLKFNIPVIVNKEYNIPGFVNSNTLFIACSYSGNTEETLEAFENAKKQKATIICITSGGKLEELAKKNKLNLVNLPKGFPPRSAIAYSFTALLKTFEELKYIKSSYTKEIYETVAMLNDEEKNIKKIAKTIASKLYKRFPILYAINGNEGVLVRFRQQLNENSKILASHHIIPEMNHNELVGWRNKMDSAVVIFRTKFDHKRSQMRIDINKPIFKKYTKSIIEIFALGDTWLQQSIYLIHLGDWISVYLAEKNKVDATEVKVIDHLKGALSKN